ncbi:MULTISPECIES: hypothetical protein [Burkholderia]|uniref:hypothetical protein n=1 Tax=Burkholderia TaxID=32008 RepID=UPI00126A4CF4|nr:MULTISPECIES: hypothetical protein [Burkholderia]
MKGLDEKGKAEGAVRNGRWGIIARPCRMRRAAIRRAGAPACPASENPFVPARPAGGIRTRDITPEALPARAPGATVPATRHFGNGKSGAGAASVRPEKHDQCVE